MPKHDVGSPKWLDNKMKSKGLGKLRWYCQMCQKQCRDENGFKCHRESQEHQRMMELFIANPNSFMDNFSSEFEAGFMKLMETRYCGKRVFTWGVLKASQIEKIVWMSVSMLMLFNISSKNFFYLNQKYHNWLLFFCVRTANGNLESANVGKERSLAVHMF